MEPAKDAHAGDAGVPPPTSIGPYVLDFYCAKAGLAVDPRTEIRGNGMSHDLKTAPNVTRAATPGFASKA